MLVAHTVRVDNLGLVLAKVDAAELWKKLRVITSVRGDASVLMIAFRTYLRHVTTLVLPHETRSVNASH